MKLYSIMSCHAFKGSILTVSLLLKTIQGIYFVKKEISFVWSNKVLKKKEERKKLDTTSKDLGISNQKANLIPMIFIIFYIGNLVTYIFIGR